LWRLHISQHLQTYARPQYCVQDNGDDLEKRRQLSEQDSKNKGELAWFRAQAKREEASDAREEVIPETTVTSLQLLPSS
jgi:hypothetical protein